jgi:hypothetical protein
MERHRGRAVRTPAAAAAAATVALALACVATAALAGERPAKLGDMAASGAVELSGPGGTILDVRGMRPGWSASGTVVLSNVGEAHGRLSLERTGLSDVAGRGGAVLSAALVLRVEQLGPQRLVYEGSLDGFALLDLGPLAGDEVRVYRLTVTLPDGGRPPGPVAGDNAFQGASTQVDWEWSATTLEPTPTPTPTPTATPTPPQVQPPVAATPDLPVVVGGGAPRLALRLPFQRVLQTRGITMFGTCDVRCAVSYLAYIETAHRGGGRRRTLQRVGVFRGEHTHRWLPAGSEQRLFLRLTRRGMRTLEQALHRHGRATVLIQATARGEAGGEGSVRRRILLVNRGSTLRR